jgi:hypothetical protein
VYVRAPRRAASSAPQQQRSSSSRRRTRRCSRGVALWGRFACAVDAWPAALCAQAQHARAAARPCPLVRRVPMAGREPNNMQSRVVLVNTFTVETVHMLNRFAVQAERGLEHVNECATRARGWRAHARAPTLVTRVRPETRTAAAPARRQIQNLEIALNLLEAKLQRCRAPTPGLRGLCVGIVRCGCGADARRVCARAAWRDCLRRRAQTLAQAAPQRVHSLRHRRRRLRRRPTGSLGACVHTPRAVSRCGLTGCRVRRCFASAAALRHRHRRRRRRHALRRLRHRLRHRQAPLRTQRRHRRRRRRRHARKLMPPRLQLRRRRTRLWQTGCVPDAFKRLACAVG